MWDITQGQPDLKPFTPGLQSSAIAGAPDPGDTKSATVQFWTKQHAAMDAMKRERNFATAAALFREALALNPNHEDSHYYLANCYADLGDIPSAIAELDALSRINPQNHRAFQRKGELLAASATSRSQLAVARQALSSALRLNSEETGTLVLLGEVDLARGDLESAQTILTHVSQANPRAANAWYFRGYVAWKKGDSRTSTKMLQSAHQAFGADWKPAGSVLEGDVRQRMFSEAGFLGLFAQQWDGTSRPAAAYAQLDAYLLNIR